ncbi:aminotransferase-like domain-containing protein [Dongia sedimenti]|uniref:PLP-dependent aminotransferase family protein n=1 Tax=Dongia sedimenti TaxID=3064282 RepID=A0ABU0YTL6_9PROT|nr:PLP-dependent aminotransferase family protein [Rhodospirillaceae bacterium R-7]
MNQPAVPLNMTGNLPPKVPAVFDGEYRMAIDAVFREWAPNDLIGAHQFHGSARDRAAGAAFLARRFGAAPDPDCIVVTNGTQSSLVMLLAGLVGKGGKLAIEDLSYPTMRNFTDMLDIGLSPVTMDEEGLQPDALEAVFRTDRPRALYTLPTLQNPTVVTMSAERRRAIAALCRKYGVAIIEDDIYSMLPQNAPAPLASFAPEISWYILGTAKCMAAALKVAYLLAPTGDAARANFWPSNRATFWMCAPINSAVASTLIENGGAGRIIDAVRTETRARQALVSEQLAGSLHRNEPECLHVWLSLPASRPREDFVARVRTLGAAISPSDTYFLGGDGAPPNAVRFGTGMAPTRAGFERGLAAIVNIYRN